MHGLGIILNFIILGHNYTINRLQLAALMFRK
jgi:hypothetical protein